MPVPYTTFTSKARTSNIIKICYTQHSLRIDKNGNSNRTFTALAIYQYSEGVNLWIDAVDVTLDIANLMKLKTDKRYFCGKYQGSLRQLHYDLEELLLSDLPKGKQAIMAKFID